MVARETPYFRTVFDSIIHDSWLNLVYVYHIWLIAFRVIHNIISKYKLHQLSSVNSYTRRVFNMGLSTAEWVAYELLYYK